MPQGVPYVAGKNRAARHGDRRVRHRHICAAATGWIPLVFVLSAVAAVVGIVLGVLGLRRARQQDGYGRDFAAWAWRCSVAACRSASPGSSSPGTSCEQIDRYDDPGE